MASPIFLTVILNLGYSSSRYILNTIFPPFKWNKKKTIWGKIDVVLSTIVATWFYSIIIYLFVYTPLFYEKQTYEQVTIYTKNNPQIDIKQHVNFIKTDPLYNKASNIKIYLIHNRLLYNWLLSPATVPSYFLNKINGTNLANEGVTFHSFIFLNNKSQTRDTIDNYISHELVHTLQAKKFGLFSTLFVTPGWVNEGYATYRSHLFSNIPIEELSVNNSYKKSAILIEHAINNMGVGVIDLHQGKFKYEDILSSFCKLNKICSNAPNY